LVGVFEVGDPHQLAVGGVAPAVIRATEDWRVALVVPADLHATVGTGVQENMDPALAVAAENHRFLAHGRHEKVSRFADLALVSDVQPSPGEQLLLFLGVYLRVDEDFPADEAGVQIDQRIGMAVLAAGLAGGCHVWSPP